MAKRKIDGVKADKATTEQLSTYAKAEEQIKIFKVPRIYDSSDPDARVFFACFDGTDNDATNEKKPITNVGLLREQIANLANANSNIGGFYIEGPGTQGGITGRLDAAWGGTYHKRIETMYEKLAAQVKIWRDENPEAKLKISVISVGFSRGAEQAAGFSRLVDERGIQDPESKMIESLGNGTQDNVSYTNPPLCANGTVPQVLALYDPVGTGAPKRNDRSPPPSAVSGIQIIAADEYRKLFKYTAIIEQGESADGRFLGVITAGAHSDIGGGYRLNGLALRNFNLVACYLNKALGEELIKEQDLSKALGVKLGKGQVEEKDFIHHSSRLTKLREAFSHGGRQGNHPFGRTGDQQLGLTVAVDNLADRFYREQFQFAPARGRTFSVLLHVRGRR